MIETRAVQFAIQSMAKHLNSHEIGKHNSCCISVQNVGNQIRIVITKNKANLDSPSVKKDHDYCWTFAWNTECSLGESSNKGC